MTSTATKAKLADMGFAFDEERTHKSEAWPHYWRGFVVPLKPMRIDGDVFEGFAVNAERTGTRKELDAEAIAYATELIS